MLFAELILERIIVFAFVQIWPIIYFPYFARKLLKRTKNRSTITLSVCFINFAIVFIIALFSIFFIGNPVSKILYSISLYLFMANQGLFVLTTWFITRLAKKTELISIILIIMFYLIASSYVFWIGFPYEGIIYDASTGWRPEYSIFFFWISFFYVTCALIIPEFLLARKILGAFKGLPIENRVKMFILGGLLNFFEIYFLLIYNSMPENFIYRAIHPFVAFVFNIIATYLAYRGIGRALE